MNSSKEALSIGFDSKPPILYREEYEQWRLRFLIFMKMQLFGKYMIESIKQGPMEPVYTVIPANPSAHRPELEIQLKSYDSYTPQEKARYDANKAAQNYLITSLTDDVLRKLDS